MTDARDQFALVRSLRAQNDALATENATLKSGGGDGTFGGVGIDWKKSVDDQLKTLHDDFRKLIGWLIAAVATPLIAITGLYVYTGSKIDSLENKIALIQVGQASANGNAQAMDARINGKLDVIAAKIEKR